jgi:hypothetical protein
VAYRQVPIASCSSTVMSHSTSESDGLTAGQRCIAIDELASMIVGVGGYGFSDYLHMAVSCRAFMDLALDVLWADGQSLG